MNPPRRLFSWQVLGPGLLLAATGVGAGDLATAAFSGSILGTSVLWAVVLGAAFKFFLTEGLARWQLVTGRTFLEGAVERWGIPLAVFFLPYLGLWTYFVGSALVSACGVTLTALVPLGDPQTSKVAYGIGHSLVGALLVLAGGFRWFERSMSVCIGVMFLTVTLTAGFFWPGWDAVLKGLLQPHRTPWDEEGLTWTVALLGGVGGTLTILCYGYWIRERNRTGPEALALCRLDLGVGYVMTALFGMAMLIIGSGIDVSGRGASLIIDLADQLEEPLGPVGRWIFLFGAWSAVFSSLLGVWQAVPFLFADFWMRLRGQLGEVDPRARPYRGYLAFLALVSLPGLLVSFQEIQKMYALVGACFIPLLALALLWMNREPRLGNHRNRLPSKLALGLALAFFGWVVVRKLSA